MLTTCKKKKKESPFLVESMCHFYICWKKQVPLQATIMKKLFSFLLCLLFVAISCSFAQQIDDTNEQESNSLKWAEKYQLNDSLYKSMEEFIQSGPITLKKPRFIDNAVFNYIQDYRATKQREKELNETLQQQKEETKEFMKEHFAFHDSNPVLSFLNEDEIETGWKYPFSQTERQKFEMKGKEIIVLSSIWGSGIIRTTFDVFEKNAERWELLTSSTLYHNGQIIPVEIKTSEDLTALCFTTPSGSLLSELKIAE